jgi:hypothetical protein
VSRSSEKKTHSSKAPIPALSLFTPYFPPSDPFSCRWRREPLLHGWSSSSLPPPHGSVSRTDTSSRRRRTDPSTPRPVELPRVNTVATGPSSPASHPAPRGARPRRGREGMRRSLAEPNIPKLTPRDAPSGMRCQLEARVWICSLRCRLLDGRRSSSLHARPEDELPPRRRLRAAEGQAPPRPSACFPSLHPPLAGKHRPEVGPSFLCSLLHRRSRGVQRR